MSMPLCRSADLYPLGPRPPATLALAFWWTTIVLVRRTSLIGLAAVALAQPPTPVAVGPVRYSVNGDKTRVVVEAASRVPYQAARLSNPERIFFDFSGARTRSALKLAETIPVGSPLLKQIRVGGREGAVVRVVLDVATRVEYTASWMTDPARLVIELRPAGTPSPGLTQPGPVIPKPADVKVPTQTPQPVAPSNPISQPPAAPAAGRIPAFRVPQRTAPRPIIAEPASEPAPAPPVETAAAAPAPANTTPTPTKTPEGAAAKPLVIEQIVAKVNGDIITLGEISRTREQVVTELKRQQAPEQRSQQVLKQIERDALRDRIDQLLLVQKSKELNITVDQDLSKYMAQLQLESKITDPDKFQQYVRDQSGMSFEDFKQQAKDGMLTREVIRREVAGRIVIPRTDLKKYYDEHHDEFVREEQVLLREIFLSTEGKDAAATAAVEKKAKDLVARARKAENFGNLAHDNSDAETAKNYGELPPFKRGDLRKEIETLVFDKSKGYVTDPIRQPNGFLILKVEERYQAGLQPFESVENEIMDKLYRPKMDPAVRGYLTKLRQDAYLQIRPGYVDSGAAPGKDTTWKDPAKLVPATVTKEEVASRPRRKRLMWVVPIPGTKSKPKQ